jgi:CoA ligase
VDGVVPWPADLAYAYRVAGCWLGRTIGSYLWEWAQSRGGRTAVVDGPTRLSYVDLAGSTDVLAAGLARLGLVRGDTVLIQVVNSWEFLVATLACVRLGVVPVMMLPAHRDYEMVSIATHVRAKALIVPDQWRGYDHQALAGRVTAALPWPTTRLVVGDEVGPGCVDLRTLLRSDDPGRDAARRRKWLDDVGPVGSDVAVLLLSGGTTGVPKVIPRTHDDYLYNVRRAVVVCAIDADTVYLAALPIGHNFALACPGVLGTLFAGGRVVLAASPRPATVFEAIATEGVTVTSAVPAVASAWVDEVGTNRCDLSSLRYLHIGGSVLAPDVAERIAAALSCRLQQVYGMAEGLICYTAPDAPGEVAFHTQGTPISPYDELVVVDEAGRPVLPGEVGELLTRGPYTPRGYFAVPAQNLLSFTPDGFYRTGDLVRITPGGHVVVCGRVKDLINRAGEKVAAGEVEALVQEIPAVAEVAAVPTPDPTVGERVCVVLRLHPGCQLDLNELATALRARGLAEFKIPERLVVVDELPHTGVGKPDKKALRSMLEAEPAGVDPARG